jgi:hypothetical protein
MDLAWATAETELQGCEEAEVFERSLIDDLNEERKDYLLDTAIREPSRHPECCGRAEREELHNRMGKEIGRSPLDRVRVSPSSGSSMSTRTQVKSCAIIVGEIPGNASGIKIATAMWPTPERLGGRSTIGLNIVELLRLSIGGLSLARSTDTVAAVMSSCEGESSPRQSVNSQAVPTTLKDLIQPNDFDE